MIKLVEMLCISVSARLIQTSQMIIMSCRTLSHKGNGCHHQLNCCLRYTSWRKLLGKKREKPRSRPMTAAVEGDIPVEYCREGRIV